MARSNISGAVTSIAHNLAMLKHVQAQKEIAENGEKDAPAPQIMPQQPIPEQPAPVPTPEQPAPAPEQPQQSALEKAGFQIYSGEGLGKRQWNPVQVEQEALQRLHERTNMVSNIAPKPPTLNPARRGAYDDTFMYKVNGGWRRRKKSEVIPSPPTTVTVREEDK